MPYLSHPVRRIREDPTAGEDVSLLLGFDEDDEGPPIEAVEAVVADVGGTVDRQLEFATVEVTVPEPAVPRLCELDGLSRVETSGRLGLAVETSGRLGLAVDTVAGSESPHEDASNDQEDGSDDAAESDHAADSDAPGG